MDGGRDGGTEGWKEADLPRPQHTDTYSVHTPTQKQLEPCLASQLCLEEAECDDRLAILGVSSFRLRRMVVVPFSEMLAVEEHGVRGLTIQAG